MHVPPGAAGTSLIVRSELSELSRVSDWVEAWAQQCGLPDALAQILDLCTAELVTNIVSYAYDDNAAHPIELSLAMEENRIRLEVKDEGKPFDPLESAAHTRGATLEGGRIGGWGLGIVRHFAEALSYCRADARNQLTVVFGNRG
jgi:serine/threonine-protein kinase RsbW